MSLSLEEAQALDAADSLAPLRERFHVLPGRIYMDGNSLGLASRDAERAVLDALSGWRERGIDGWTDPQTGWFTLAERVGARLARLVGAHPDEVVATGQTTANLHALVATFFTPQGPLGRRTKILADALNFPSDRYALEGQLRLRGLDPARHLVVVPSRDGLTLDEADLIAAMTDEVALAVLPAVLYRSGQLLDLPRLAGAARERGVLLGLDCSHSAGCVPHRLHDWGVDFATWCTYKYLNGGPGAVGALFVHRRHHGTPPALPGWWGSAKERQFDLSPAFTPAPGAGAWQIGTPPVLSLAALDGALTPFEGAGIEAVRAKSLALTGYLLRLLDARLAGSPYGFRSGTPREPARRGGHVALLHPEAVRLARALKARAIIPDFRPPDVVRLAPVALYTTYAEVWHTVQALREIVDAGEHLAFSAERGVVA